MGFLGDVLGTVADIGTLGLDRPLENQLSGNANPYRATAPGGTAYTDQMTAAGAQAQQGNQSQNDLIKMLTQQANGQGPSAAQGMLQQQTQANNANAASAVASQRGMNPAAAAKLILDQQAGQQQQAAGQGATMRAHEMLSARGQLGSAINTQRGQNLSAFGQAGGLENQAQLGSQGINAGITGANSSAVGKLLGGGLSALGAVAGMPPGGGGGGGNAIPDASAGSYGQNYAIGGPIPGAAPVAGDSPRNDTVHAMLSPGEIVLPRSVAQAEDAPGKARAFVEAVRRKKDAEAGPKGYAKVLMHTRRARAALDALEKHVGGAK